MIVPHAGRRLGAALRAAVGRGDATRRGGERSAVRSLRDFSGPPLLNLVSVNMGIFDAERWCEGIVVGRRTFHGTRGELQQPV